MTLAPVDVLSVGLELKDGATLPVGRLATRRRRIFFEFDPTFLRSGLSLSPYKLPLEPGVHVARESIFDGLFGVFNDSLPDGWGLLLLDRQLRQRGIEPGALTPLDRLALVGSNAMGALRYEPDRSPVSADNNPLVLDDLAAEADRELSGTPSEILERLVLLAGSSAGARSKILANLSADRSVLRQGTGPRPEGFTPWLIKFRASGDDAQTGTVEYAYSLMARAAGLEIPETHLFASSSGPGYFGVRRFDRTESGAVHMHTASGLLHTDHRLPSLDYDNLLKAARWLTRDMTEVEKLYRLAVFNVFSHNRDDHPKNVSFLMDASGHWCVSPAYDLTFSAGPGGEHSMIIAGEGRSPGQSHLQRLGTDIGIARKKVLSIIEEVTVTVVSWPTFAADARVSEEKAERIQQVLNRIALQVQK